VQGKFIPKHVQEVDYFNQTRILRTHARYDTDLHRVSACRLASSTSSLTFGGTALLAISFMISFDFGVKEATKPPR